jgi:hypothetical protein
VKGTHPPSSQETNRVLGATNEGYMHDLKEYASATYEEAGQFVGMTKLEGVGFSVVRV